MVLDAYTWTLTHPTASADWIYADLDGNIRCCPFVAVALYAKKVQEPAVRRLADLTGGLHSLPAFIQVICDGPGSTTEVLGVVRRLLDISRPYLHGYIWGYDRWPLDPYWVEPWHQDYDLGYADGGLTREMLELRDFRIHLM
jgi:hypothetical protein